MSVRRVKRRDPKTGAVREFWLIDVVFERPNGTEQRVRKVSSVQTKRGAEAYERQLREALVDGAYDQKKQAETKEKNVPKIRQFSKDFIEVYARSNNKPSEVATKSSYVRNHILPVLGEKQLDCVTALDIERLKADLLNKGYAKKTVANVLGVLGRMFSLAVEWGLIAQAPQVKQIRVPEAEFDFLTFDEAARLVDGAEQAWHPMIVIGLKTGLRLGELIALQWDDVDLVKGSIVVRHAVSKGQMMDPKGGRKREVPLSEEALRTLKRHRHLRGEFVFCNADGRRLTKDQCPRPLRRACTKAKLRKVGWHVLRHSFASHLIIRGVPLKVVQELLGHASITTTMRYAHLTPDVRRDSVTVLDLPPPNAGEQSDGNLTATQEITSRKQRE
jgi:integrase